MLLSWCVQWAWLWVWVRESDRGCLQPRWIVGAWCISYVCRLAVLGDLWSGHAPFRSATSTGETELSWLTRNWRRTAGKKIFPQAWWIWVGSCIMWFRDTGSFRFSCPCFDLLLCWIYQVKLWLSCRLLYWIVSSALSLVWVRREEP